MLKSFCIVRNALLIISGAAVLSGCGTLPSGRGWGEDATYRPGWQRVRSAAADAALDPWVWAPLVGAAVFQIDGWDREVADWARRQTPVFGSQNSARQWSDDLRSASVFAHYATILATPGGSQPSEWFLNKAKGALVNVAAVSVTGQLTQLGKAQSGRQRPNGADDESFPSGHTSSSAVHTRLASRNLQSVNLPRFARRGLDAGLFTLTAGTAWARIEAGWHYPADTLAGMALGNFFASFMNDAFLGLDSPNAGFAVVNTGEGATLQWRQRF